MIAIIDYGLGNLGSIANMLKVIGSEFCITSEKKMIAKANKIILPGVGAFDMGVNNLKQRDLNDFLKNEVINNKKPILGICLGMQLLGRFSEEGCKQGLNLIPFDNIRFTFKEKSLLKVPHMGWNVVSFEQKSFLLDGIIGEQRYYFVHSYHAICDSNEDILMKCEYGYEFPAAVCKGNIYGLQFHPEKSHNFGMKLLSNFVTRC